MTSTSTGSTRWLVGLLAVTLIACGGDAGVTPDAAVDAPPVATAADYAGSWLMTEITVPDGDAMLTLRRDGVARSIRGDARFTATDDASGTLDVRQVALVGGLIASPVFVDPSTVTVEADRWLVESSDDEVVVFLTSLAGDHLVLTHDPTDPRDNQPEPPSSVEVDRVAPWSTTLVGSWDLVSITIDGTARPAGQCLEVEPGVTWATIAMAIEVDARLLFTRVMTLHRYSDAGCVVATGEEVSTQTGYGEEEDGVVARFWAVEGDRSEYQEFAIAVAAEVVTLTLDACLPLPTCVDTAPSEVVIERRAP